MKDVSCLFKGTQKTHFGAFSLRTGDQNAKKNLNSEEQEMINSAKEKCNKRKPVIETMTPVRLKQSTYSKVTGILAHINQKAIGKKVRADDVIALSLTLVKNEHYRQLEDASLTNADRMEILFEKFKSRKNNATRDDFLGALLKGEISPNRGMKTQPTTDKRTVELVGATV
jgi:hypothetical protein